MSHRIVLGCGALVALALSPRAEAVPSRIVEFQLDTEPFLDLVKDAILVEIRDGFGCPEPFEYGGVELIIDHVEPSVPFLTTSTNPTSLTFAAGTASLFTPSVVVPIVVHTKEVSCVRDPACALDETTTVPVWLEFELVASGNEICADFAQPWIDLDPATAALIPAIPSMCAPVDVRALTNLVEGFAVTDSAIALSGEDRLSIRLAGAGSSSTVADWTAFLGGAFAPAPATPTGFSAFLEDSLLTDSMVARLDENLVCDPSDPTSDACTDDIEIDNDTTASWWAWPPMVMADMDVIVDVCTGIGADVSLALLMSLSPAGDALELEGDLTYDLVDSDVILCSLFNPSHFLSFLPIESFTLFGVIADAYDPSDEISDHLPDECVLDSDSHVSCSFPLALDDLSFGNGTHVSFEPTILTGVADGLVLGGEATSVGVGIALPTLTLDGFAPILGFHGDCDSLDYGWSGTLEVGGHGGQYCPDPEPAVAAANDPLGVFDYHLQEPGPPEDATIDFPNGEDPAPYFADPYPFVATIWTTHGSGSVDLGVVLEGTAATPEDWHDAKLDQLMDCWRIESGWLGIPGEFDPHWLPYPELFDVSVVTNDPLWQAARPQGVIRELVVVTSAPPDRLAAGGVLFRPGTATLVATLHVDGGEAGSFDTTFETPLTVELFGQQEGEFAVLELAQDFVSRVPVSRGSLPRGVSGATVTVDLDVDSALFAGTPLP